MCDHLIVGINSDQLIECYKNKKPVIPEEERKMIVESIRYVDECIIVNSLDKSQIYANHKFNKIFIGSDWKGNKRWKQTEEYFREFGVEVVYLPHTDGISTTQICEQLKDKN